MLNPIEKIKVAILNLNTTSRDCNDISPKYPIILIGEYNISVQSVSPAARYSIVGSN